MRLKSYQVRNYKSIEEGTIETSEISILVGKNNSGKSNLIESLIDYKDLVERGGVRRRNSSNWISDRIINKNNKDKIEFISVYEISDIERRELILEKIKDLGIRSGKKTALIDKIKNNNWLTEIKNEITVGKDNTKNTFKMNIDGEFVGDDHRNKRLDLGEAHQIVSKDPKIIPVDKLAEQVKSWSYLNAFRKPKDTMRVEEKNEMDESGSNLVRVFDTIYRNNPKLFEEIREKYLEIIGGVNDLRTRLAGKRTTTYVDEEPFSEGFRLDEISAGSRQILMLLTKIIISDKNSQLLILEEPELHLHPDVQQQLFQIIKNISNGFSPQVVISTHSKTFVEKAEIDDIVFVERDGESVLKTVENGEELQANLTDLGYEASDVIQSEKVLFVEGRSDRVVLKQFSETLGTSFEEQGAKVVRLKGDQMFNNAKPMVRLLRQLDIPYKFILDSDGKDPSKKREEVRCRIEEPPDRIHVLSRYSIESYLTEHSEPISRAFDVELDKVEEYLKENRGTENKAGVLDTLYTDIIGQSSNKSAIAGMISRHIDREEIPDEIVDLIKEIEEM